MIHAVTLNYRLAGVHEPGSGETGQATISVVQKDEKAAFDQAVEQLKVDLLQAAADYPIGRRDAFRNILRLRPWVHSYTYTPRASSSTWDWSDPRHADRIV